MTGQELIDFIQSHELEDFDIVTHDEYGDEYRFGCGIYSIEVDFEKKEILL